MLLSFEFENWMSFRDRVSISMVASKERHHRNRIVNLKKFGLHLLPIAAIYGGNASGKSNFYQALDFVRSFVLMPLWPDGLIGTTPFTLDSVHAEAPSRFKLELLCDDLIYEFSFSVTQTEVIEERLVEIDRRNELELYHREKSEIVVDESLKTTDAQFFEVASKGTQDNQLFLSNCIRLKNQRFEKVYRWFRDQLELISPDTVAEPFINFIQENHALYAQLNALIAGLDMGIDHIGLKPVSLDALEIPRLWMQYLQENLKDKPITLRRGSKNERYIFNRENGEIKAQKLLAYHPDLEGGEKAFEFYQESDGSQRTLDLLPAFMRLMESDSQKTYIIDELDRSLHPLLTRGLITQYLETCHPHSRSQLIFTTHDVMLMDPSLLRRDEMWITEREQGISKLYSLIEYKDALHDKDLRKSYLQGRMGGIPRLLLHHSVRSSDGN